MGLNSLPGVFDVLVFFKKKRGQHGFRIDFLTLFKNADNIVFVWMFVHPFLKTAKNNVSVWIFAHRMHKQLSYELSYASNFLK